MKNKHFYSHLIEETVILAPIDKLDLTISEKEELAMIIRTNIHHLVLDTVLAELSKEDGQKLIKHVLYGEDDHIWELLNQKIDLVEEKIKKTIEAHLHEIAEETEKLINEG